MKKIRILIADDHSLVRLGFSALLRYQKDMVVVGSAADGEEAIRLATDTRPDVIVMDLVMPVLDGVDATKRIHDALPDTKIIVLTSFGASDSIAHALRNGASGAVLKSAEDTELIAAIRAVIAGERYLSDDIRKQLTQDPPIPDLTPRQEQILQSMTRGLTNAEIAKQLGIRRDGVNLHVIAILQKIGAANRTEAVAIALRKNLLKM